MQIKIKRQNQITLSLLNGKYHLIEIAVGFSRDKNVQIAPALQRI
jgi:hypothetical protein